ncbi:Crp/Fnr family transcriptional regulator [Sphingomicrobium sediminis]|uniref:Crp/Fnr family transcriptional regulator n=1 Tax=Sphingomicrobium sediminis TaxID=2950949 RepID=A0A9X2J3S5_9SPHN|nr:Crp/Fnr family transcriptional regulator [Sphingomicrobium sediminis]MCM8558370.1 Crp/Fnr family transcriptional regulator [Sphingomicrobium sediminis]
MNATPASTLADDPVDLTRTNHLIGMMTDNIRDRLLVGAERLEFDAGHTLFTSGDQIAYTYFPLAPTMVSMLVDLNGDRRVEVATIGKEGAIGGVVSCGDLPAYTRCEVQVAGPALRVPMSLIEELKRESLFVRDLLCRYADALLAQVMQSVACNAFHSIEGRAARWLLTAQDRAGDELALTQETFAALLGVKRSSVNPIARALQEEGLIRYSRGIVTICNRDGLKKRACECYDRVRNHFDAVIGDEQAAWIEACEG